MERRATDGPGQRRGGGVCVVEGGCGYRLMDGWVGNEVLIRWRRLNDDGDKKKTGMRREAGPGVVVEG